MNITKRDALITALSYADVFDYPLTQEELITWVPFINPVRHSLVASQERVMRGYRKTANDIEYFSIRPGKRLVETRNKRLQSSIEKWHRARWAAGLVRWIPSVRLVGLTGGLTRSNAKDEDDIDLFIICASKTLWITRAMTTILLDIFRLRRRPKDQNVQNLICLNMFMSEDGLRLPTKERDLFSAHEVLLMTPLWGREGVYEHFLSVNPWVKKFLPTAWKEKFQASSTKYQTISKFKISNNTDFPFGYWHLVLWYCLGFVIWLLRFTEVPTRVLQLWYMSKRRSTEIVTDTMIRFHPHDARVWIKKKLGWRLTRFNIPLDKIFYAR